MIQQNIDSIKRSMKNALEKDALQDFSSVMETVEALDGFELKYPTVKKEIQVARQALLELTSAALDVAAENFQDEN